MTYSKAYKGGYYCKGMLAILVWIDLLDHIHGRTPDVAFHYGDGISLRDAVQKARRFLRDESRKRKEAAGTRFDILFTLSIGLWSISVIFAIVSAITVIPEGIRDFSFAFAWTIAIGSAALFCAYALLAKPR